VPAVETTNIEAEQTMQSHHSYDNLKLCGRDFNALDSRMLGQHAGLDVLAAGAAADSPLSIVVEAAFESKRADMLELLQVLNPTARECNSDNPMSAINQSISSSMVCSAAQHGQLDCLRFLTAAAAVGTVSTRHHIPERDRCAVSSSQQLEEMCLPCSGCSSRGSCRRLRRLSPACAAAVHGRDAAVWLHQQKFELGPQACTGAARAGNLDCCSGCTAVAHTGKQMR
jgi:hypothetical protein